MKQLFLMLGLSLILVGCANTQGYKSAPEKLAPDFQDMERIESIGVITASTKMYEKKLSLHDKQVMKSMGEGAVHGMMEGLDAASDCSGDFCGVGILLLPVFTLAGAAIGAANPNQVPVNATDEQNRLMDAMFNAGLMSVASESHVLQNALAEYGNKLTSHLFIPVDQFKPIGKVRAKNNRNTDVTIDAYIRPSNFRILLVGEQSSDPRLKLIVKGRYALIRSIYPDKCLGWFSGTWTGSTKKLSLWRKDDAAMLKQQLDTAFREQAHEAVSFLFNPSEDKINRHEIYDSYPAWLECFEARYKKISNYADWYCDSADAGIADSQRRIGDLYYESSAKDGKVRAYAWYSLAATGNNTDAAKSLMHVSQELSPEELTHAEHLLQLWRPGSCRSDLLSLSDDGGDRQ